MKRTIGRAAVFAGVVIGAPPIAAQDYCGDVLRYAARNETIETYSLGVAMSTYDSVCSGSTYKSGTQFNAGLSAVIEAVPIEFNLGSGSTADRTSYFCRTFFESYKRNEARFRSTKTVVVEAVTAWQNCMSLWGEGVEFKPRISSTQVLVEVRRVRVGVPVRVDGIGYDAALLECDVPNTDTSDKREKATSKTTKTLADDYWTITCMRKPKTEGTDTVYPKADFSVRTTKGSFLLPISADAVVPYQWAKEIDGRLESVKGEMAGLRARLEARVDGQRVQCQDINTGVATSATHYADFGFPVRVAWATVFGNITDARSVSTSVSGNRVTVTSEMSGTGPGGAGVIAYRVCATSF